MQSVQRRKNQMRARARRESLSLPMMILACYAIVVVFVIVLLLQLHVTGDRMRLGKPPLILQILCQNYPKKPPEIYRNSSEWQYAGYIRRNDTVLFSAFLDERMIDGSKGVVRVFGFADSVAENAPFHCQLWYKGEAIPVIRRAQLSQIGGGHRIGDSYFIEYLFSCSGVYHKESGPSHVSIVPNDCGEAGNLLLVHTPTTPKVRHFGLCVPPSPSPNPTTLDLIEWLESNRRFGVSRVHYYYMDVTEDIRKVLNYYENGGFVRRVKMASPLSINNDVVTRLAAIIAMNDCMYRNMESFRYLMVLFPDEIVVPKRHQTYHKLLEAVSDVAGYGSKQPVKSFTFRSATFWTNLSWPKTEGLRLFHNLFRSAPSPFLYQSRSFVSPKFCISVFENYCWMKMPLGAEKWTVDVNEAMALKHHYMPCVNCKMTGGALYRDLSVLRFRKYLKFTILDAMHKILQHSANRTKRVTAEIS
ncbi:uncharacterized protein LOC135488700 isoform X1 [Lineus longissimus]|uniref:uncharacterized protein LOC135488700 isoform X1 n=1 Tax=Lineus longissimus TaxID=88925 RepID=UPI00315C5BCA